MKFNKKKAGVFLLVGSLISTSVYGIVNSVLESGKYKWNPVGKWVNEGEIMYSEEKEEGVSKGYRHSFAFIRSDQIKLRRLEESHITDINNQISLLNKNIEQLRAQLGPQCIFGMEDQVNCQISLPYPCNCGKHGCDTCLRITDQGITSRLKIYCHDIQDISGKSDDEIAQLHSEWESELNGKSCDDDGVFCGPPGYCHLREPTACSGSSVDNGKGSVSGGNACIPGFEDINSLQNVASAEGKADAEALGQYTEKKEKEQQQREAYKKQMERYYSIVNSQAGTIPSYTKDQECFIYAVEKQKDNMKNGCNVKYIPDPDKQF